MRALVLVVLCACSEEVTSIDFGGKPAWTEVTLEGAEDLGHTPEVIASQVAPGRIDLADVTMAAGLGNAVGRGNSHGVGIAFVDLTGDDRPDIFVANGMRENEDVRSPSKLYRNEQDGTFTDVTAEWGLDAIASKDCFSVAAADYDNDGDIDLYLGTRPNDVLLRNEGDRFADVTAEAGAGGPASNEGLFGDGRSKVVAFGDYDLDGWLDIVSASSTLPDPFAYLLRNKGDGTFEDVSERTRVQASPYGNPCAVMWSDHDNDRDPDLWIWNDRGDHILLLNEGGERFGDFTEGSRLSEVSIGHPMGIDAADIDRDGDLDFYISNIGNNPLLRNNGDGTFTDITRDAGTGGDFGWGLAFEDFDLDGWPDIFVAQEDNRPNLVFRNLGQSPPRFDQLEFPHPEVDSGASHNVAAGFADYDRDGRVDVVAATTDGSRIVLYKNETEVGTGRWLHVEVARAPNGGNLRAIGARVLVKTGELVQFRDLTAGSSRASQNEHTVRFGLGEWSGAEWVAVQWPSGAQKVVRNVEGNRRVMVEFD
jgi:enediyne biosynthesis protein E4